MDTYICCHCNCPYHYYSNIKHASRKSCRVSKNGHHAFTNKHIHNLNMFFKRIFKNIYNKLFRCFSHF